jgi:hypothetical protein
MDRIASENGCAGLVREHDSGAVNLHGASHLIARLAFEARYSGARQYIFRIEITVMGSVSFRRELPQKCLQRRGFEPRNWSLKLQNRKIPCKIPY